MNNSIVNEELEVKDILQDKYRVIFVDEKGNMICKENDQRLKSAKWYKKLLAKISKSYRSKYIDYEGFNITLEELK